MYLPLEMYMYVLYSIIPILRIKRIIWRTARRRFYRTFKLFRIITTINIFSYKMNTFSYAHCSLLISGGKQRNEMCMTPRIYTHFQVNQIPFSSPCEYCSITSNYYRPPNACKLICTKKNIRKHSRFFILFVLSFYCSQLISNKECI